MNFVRSTLTEIFHIMKLPINEEFYKNRIQQKKQAKMTVETLNVLR